MHNKLSSTIRKESTKTFAVLLDCLDSKDYQVKLLRLILPEIAAQLKIKIERTDFRSIKWLTHELQRCVHNFDNYKNPNEPLISEGELI